ncbi:hypothetical protein GCM10011297_33310 [Bacterioplanes sanyensis]|uniref:hypothetical protein n=1 Tax=Bacterioplanes sanyensis TaxID=1249553 RepID=UPI001672A26B|nr:hypothetical protein [Bacterioplanes sanyensis]GGY57969.1 hypothetical protein GCM10011297_33310 [Bacterioplanes sanyensis]
MTYQRFLIIGSIIFASAGLSGCFDAHQTFNIPQTDISLDIPSDWIERNQQDRLQAAQRLAEDNEMSDTLKEALTALVDTQIYQFTKPVVVDGQNRNSTLVINVSEREPDVSLDQVARELSNEFSQQDLNRSPCPEAALENYRCLSYAVSIPGAGFDFQQYQYLTIDKNNFIVITLGFSHDEQKAEVRTLATSLRSE